MSTGILLRADGAKRVRAMNGGLLTKVAIQQGLIGHDLGSKKR